MSDDEQEVRRMVDQSGSEPTPAQRAQMRAAVEGALEGDVGGSGQRPNHWLRWSLAAAVVAAIVVGFIAIRSRSDDEELSPVTEPSTPATVISDTTTTEQAATTTTVQPTTSTTEAPTTTTALATTTAVAPPPVAPTPLLFPSGLRVYSLAQPAANEAWAGAMDAVNGGPGQLLHSTDNGQSWHAVALPAAYDGTLDVVFADPQNGWVFGTGPVLATHDAGRHWTPTGVGASAAVTAAGGSVSAFEFDQAGSSGFQILTSPVGTDSFQPSGITMQSGAGPALDVRAASSSDSAWLMYNDRQLIDSARFQVGAWATWTSPCTVGSDGTAPADVGFVASTPDGSLVVAVCATSQFYGPPSSVRVFASGDGGTTFDPAAALPDSSVTATDGSWAPAQVAFVLVPSSNVIFVGYTATDGTSRVMVSTDSGATWNAAAPFPDADPIADGFVERGGGVVVTTQSQHAYFTIDNGQSWTSVYGGTVVQ